MNGTFDWTLFRTLPVVGILRGFAGDALLDAVTATAAGGLTTVEVTLNSPGAAAAITRLRRDFGDRLNIGAGTVRHLGDLAVALDAGAEFIVTPILDLQIIAQCKARGIPVFPGALTPTEVQQAWNAGADMVKIFPADTFGPAYIKALKGPLADIPLLPTGGVTVETLGAFHAAGAEGFGVGSPLFDKARVEARDTAWLTARARAFQAAWLAVK